MKLLQKIEHKSSKLKEKKRAFLKVKKNVDAKFIFPGVDSSKCSLTAKHTHWVSNNKEANTQKIHKVYILKIEKFEVY